MSAWRDRSFRVFGGRVVQRGLLLLTVSFACGPLVWMCALSLKSRGELFVAEPRLWPVHSDIIANYGRALTRVPLLRSLINGGLVCTTILALQVLSAAPCAYALARLRFRGRRFLFGLVLLAAVIPPQVLAVPLYLLLWRAGLLDTYAALIVPYAVSPFAMFLLRQAFQTVPDDLIQAARLDGLSEWAIVWRVMVPSTRPALGAFAVFAIVMHWNELFWPLIAIRSTHLATPALSVVFFRSQEVGTDVAPLMAAAVMIALPLVIVFLLSQRWFLADVTKAEGERT
jgi:multiple sugar transport system permease protein